MNIQIDDEFKNLIPPLTQEEYSQLEKNLIKEGCRDALVTWNGILIDGHNRYELCTKHNIEFKTINKDFKDRQEVIEWIITNQFGRRNLPNYVRGRLALRLESVIRERAKENLKTNKGSFKGNQYTNKVVANPKSENPPKTSITTSKELAQIAGVGHDTIEKIKVIEKEATPEQKKELEKGNISVNKVYRELRPKKANEEDVGQARKCDTCGVTKPLSAFHGKNNTCNYCRNYISRTGENIKKTKEKIKQFDNIDVEAMYEEMKIPTVKEENTEVKNEFIVSFNELLNKFDSDINKYTFMNFVFKNDNSSKPLVEKIISNLNKILKMMEE